MSRANERSGVKCEYEDATKTALAYLQAVGVVEPYEDSTPEYREPETNILPDAIMREAGVDDLPDDPDEDGLSTPEYRKGETVTMLAAILGATHFPNPSDFPTIRLRLAPPIWGTAIYTAGPIPESSKAFSKRIASIQRIAKP